MKSALDKDLSPRHRYRCVSFLFGANRAKPDDKLLAKAKLEMASFSLSSILPCADQEDFGIVFDALLTNIVNVTVADIEEGIHSLENQQVHFLEKMTEACCDKLDKSHFTRFAELALERDKKSIPDSGS